MDVILDEDYSSENDMYFLPKGSYLTGVVQEEDHYIGEWNPLGDEIYRIAVPVLLCHQVVEFTPLMKEIMKLSFKAAFADMDEIQKRLDELE